ncbi:hypothetical protein B0H17DRAFT_1203214 [Mycena rosella]|uniref:Uncharacterized protein n=1 Tax=Mycena rosella TaxID=1033263 RepID=A0AAD7DBU6_MYCRO|nr:hypothetical protein B0H17DRAFT_1203214 [Mycena rosella]
MFYSVSHRTDAAVSQTLCTPRSIPSVHYPPHYRARHAHQSHNRPICTLLGRVYALEAVHSMRHPPSALKLPEQLRALAVCTNSTAHALSRKTLRLLRRAPHGQNHISSQKPQVGTHSAPSNCTAQPPMPQPLSPDTQSFIKARRNTAMDPSQWYFVRVDTQFPLLPESKIVSSLDASSAPGARSQDIFRASRESCACFAFTGYDVQAAPPTINTFHAQEFNYCRKR